MSWLDETVSPEGALLLNCAHEIADALGIDDQALGVPSVDRGLDAASPTLPQVEDRPTSIAAVLGRQLEALIEARQNERVKRGTHLTPPAVALTLAEAAMQGQIPASILDPCCGAGVFLSAAAEVRMARGQPPLPGLIGRDLEPLALLATCCSLRHLAQRRRRPLDALTQGGPGAVQPPFCRHHSAL